MKPTTWLTALRRETIISSPSRTTESASARSSRARGSTDGEVALSMTTIDRPTRPMPASMVAPTPVTFSMLRWMPRRMTTRLSATGMIRALSTSAIAAGT